MQLHINATVRASLREECAMSSDGTSGTPVMKNRRSNDLTNAICEYNNYFGSSEIAKQKLV